ncbi:MAG: hypothetical protein HC888_00160 [Candidatus Competibacteraceae bacterium]|nr:hypothetical protein [Candidatus Competibacteraceae bacterium]
MKFIVTAGQLKKGLKAAIEVATKGVVKDFEHANKLTLNAAKTEVIATANGGRLSLSVKLSDIDDPNLDYSCETPGEISVSASDFASNLDAFDPKSTIIVSGDSKELIIASAADKEIFQALPVLPDSVKTPEVATSFEKEVEITRSSFLEGFNKVFYAIGFEANRDQYLYWQLRTSTEIARFAAGTGARFAVYNIEGKAVKGSSNHEFLLPKDQSPVIANILSDCDGDYVKISASSASTPPQMVFTVDTTRVILTGIDFNIKWPNIDPLLKATRVARVETRAEDWAYAVKGLWATFNNELKKQNEIHQSDISLDFDKNNINIKTDGKLRANRKVPITDIKAKTDDAVFHCCTTHIKEFIDRVDKNDKVFVEYVSSDKPLFFVLEKTNSDVSGLSRQFLAFFASLRT